MSETKIMKKSIIRAASPREVNYYFKEQKSHLSGSGAWTDEIFPPNKNSLLGLDSSGRFIDKDCEEDQWTIDNEIQPDQVVWKRARDIAELGPDCQLFSDGIDANDVQQGGLGTCYFLSAIAAITEFPSLIKDLLFKSKTKNERGIYEIVLFIDGDWMIVPVDDWFPCEADTGNLKFTRTNGKELWVILLEKAWAKVNGGYLNISGGNTIHSLFSLTGFPCSRHVHERVKNPQKLWEEILESENRDDIMCASTYGISEDEEGAQREQDYERLGLSAGHAYTLVGAKQAQYRGETLKLILLRNPHGVFTGVNTEWTGAWCDSDPRWTPELNELFHHSNKEDGCFWMDFFEFFKYYEDSFFCDILYDGKLTYFKYKDNALAVPNVISFHIEREQKMYVSVFRDTWRFVRPVKGFKYPFTLVIAGYDPQTKQISSVDGKFFYDDHHEHIKNFAPGHYFVWVYYDKESCDGPILPEYVVRVASIEDFRTKEVGTDPEFKLVQEICLQQMRNNLKPETLKNPQILIPDGDLNNTYIGCFLMQNNMKNQKLTVSGSLKYIHSYKILGPLNKQPNYSIDLNPGDANVIVAIRKPPKKGKGKKADFEITKTVRTSDPTGTGKLNLYDISSFCQDISKIKIEYSQIVNINKDQFKETKAQNKAEKVTTTSSTTTDNRGTVTRTQTIVEESSESRYQQPEIRHQETRYQSSQPETRYEQSSNEVRYQSSQPVTTTKYGQGNNYADNLYSQVDSSKYTQGNTTTKVTSYDGDRYGTTSTSKVVTYEDNNYGNKYVTGGTTTKVVSYDGDNYGGKYVSGSTTSKVVTYDDNYGGNRYVTGGTTRVVTSETTNTGGYTTYGDSGRVVTNVTRTQGGDEDYEVVNVRQVSGTTTTSNYGGNNSGYQQQGTVYRRYEN
jgi:hypothetical protein